MNPLTTEEMAARYGRTKRTLKYWVRSGCPVTKTDDGSLWDVAAVESWLKETGRWDKIQKDLKAGKERKKPGPKKGRTPSPGKRTKTPAPGGEGEEDDGAPLDTLTAARMRKELALARKHELAADQMTGDMVPREAMVRFAEKVAMVLDRLAMAIPSKLAPKIPRIKTTLEAELLLKEAMRGLLQGMSDEFSGK